MGPGPTADGEPTGELEVFATGTTVAVAPMPADHRRVGTDDRDEPTGPGPEVAHGKPYHARPGHRPGTPIATTSPRRSGIDDIVRPVLVSPLLASALATSGELFDRPVPNLEIAVQDDTARGCLVWDGRLGRGRRARPITFHLRASPSMVVTVLELVPQRRLRRQRERFVAAGVDAVDELARRLESAAEKVSAAGPAARRDARSRAAGCSE